MCLTATQSGLLKRFRSETIPGMSIDLIPLTSEHLGDVVRLRNQDSSRYNLNQSYSITMESQREWFSRYEQRDNDIYWCIGDKAGRIVGTVRLYDIDETNCEHGSFIIGEEDSMGSPFALEAMIMSLDFGFKTLGLETIECNDRCDNRNMNSITKRFGFKLKGQKEINGVPYNHYVLTKDDSKTSKYVPLLQRYMSEGA